MRTPANLAHQSPRTRRLSPLSTSRTPPTDPRCDPGALARVTVGTPVAHLLAQPLKRPSVPPPSPRLGRCPKSPVRPIRGVRTRTRSVYRPRDDPSSSTGRRHRLARNTVFVGYERKNARTCVSDKHSFFVTLMHLNLTTMVIFPYPRQFFFCTLVILLNFLNAHRFLNDTTHPRTSLVCRLSVCRRRRRRALDRSKQSERGRSCLYRRLHTPRGVTDAATDDDVHVARNAFFKVCDGTEKKRCLTRRTRSREAPSASKRNWRRFRSNPRQTAAPDQRAITCMNGCRRLLDRAVSSRERVASSKDKR